MEETKRVHIVRGLRQIWMRRKERSEALKLAKYTCQKCGKKKSVAKGKEQKVEVHHKLGVGNWDRIVQVIRDELLCSPEHLEVLCPECHKLER
jgi:5-methylcytosine-specific restriction endonuclease McrA